MGKGGGGVSKQHTPGPWDWYQSNQGVPYIGTPHSGHLLVMDFVRKGMNSAQPRFATWKGDNRERMGGIMVPAGKLVLADHPDAILIAAAPELLKACRAALDFAKWADSSGFDGGCPDIVAQLESAIRKAVIA